MAVVETVNGDDDGFPEFKFDDSSSQNSNTKATFSNPIQTNQKTTTARPTTTTTSTTTSATKKPVKPAFFRVNGDTNPLKSINSIDIHPQSTADKREGSTTMTKQKLKSAYIFNQPNLKIEEQFISTPSPRPMLEKPYQVTLQTGSDSLPLVGIYQTPPITPTDSSLMEMSTGNFGAKINDGDFEEEFEDEDEDDEMFEFRPYKNKPLIKVKSMLSKKSNENQNDEIEKKTLKIRTKQKMQI